MTEQRLVYDGRKHGSLFKSHHLFLNKFCLISGLELNWNHAIQNIPYG